MVCGHICLHFVLFVLGIYSSLSYIIIIKQIRGCMQKDKIEKFMESLYGYDDYRSFLKDYFKLQKEIKTSFTQRYFAQKAGFSSHTFCNYVVNGKRNLSTKTLRKFVLGLKLDKVKSDFFENLVNFNQADDQNEKEYYFAEMQKIKKNIKFVPITQKQSSFYEKWYYPVVRELAVNSDWNSSFKELASMVYPEITATEAEEAVKMMLDTSILIKQGENYSFAQNHIEDTLVPAFLKKKARREVFQRGVEVLDQMSPDKRFAAYSTFSADRETYEQINNLFLEYRQKMNELIVNSKQSSEVFQMTFGNFPLSRVKENNNMGENI